MNIASSTPTRVSRHSSESRPPVDTAMLGMLANFPSVRFFGSVIGPESVLAHCLTVGTVISLRHLPICTTSGMSAPSGALVMVNVPSGAVSAVVIGLPEKRASQEHEVLLTPSGMGLSAPPGLLGM